MSKEKRANIRNSTAEFLMGVLFEVSFKTINEHLINLFGQKEISREATIRNFRIVQKEGSCEVARNLVTCNTNILLPQGKFSC